MAKSYGSYLGTVYLLMYRGFMRARSNARSNQSGLYKVEGKLNDVNDNKKQNEKTNKKSMLE